MASSPPRLTAIFRRLSSRFLVVFCASGCHLAVARRAVSRPLPLLQHLLPHRSNHYFVEDGEIREGGLSPAATVMSWRGIQGGIDAAKSHTKDCALMPKCKASGYGVVTADGKFLKFDEDGGIEIHIAAEKPEGVPEENWLPIERKDLDLGSQFRLYVPDLEKLKTWQAPKAKKL